jgi:hypothetical protein
VTEEYVHIDPFHEWSVAMLQIQLAKAQAALRSRDARIAYLETTRDVLLASGATLDISDLHRKLRIRGL